MSSLQILNTDERDAMRLLYLLHLMDGMCGVDLHEQATMFASEDGREEALDVDYLRAIRFALDRGLGMPQ